MLSIDNIMDSLWANISRLPGINQGILSGWCWRGIWCLTLCKARAKPAKSLPPVCPMDNSNLLYIDPYCNPKCTKWIIKSLGANTSLPHPSLSVQPPTSLRWATKGHATTAKSEWPSEVIARLL
uniref:Uncharacterized protein n=1 Tax=Eutreptiella gymnastica TaxID=73025 RepID=A0A7S1N1U1_9EUGL